MRYFKQDLGAIGVIGTTNQASSSIGNVETPNIELFGALDVSVFDVFAVHGKQTRFQKPRIETMNLDTVLRHVWSSAFTRPRPAKAGTPNLGFMARVILVRVELFISYSGRRPVGIRAAFRESSEQQCPERVKPERENDDAGQAVDHPHPGGGNARPEQSGAAA